jgi:hypothetical protein
MILLNKFNYELSQGERRFSCHVEGGAFSSELFFVGESSTWSDSNQQTANWALISLLYPAMAIGENLHVESIVSKTLLFNLNNDFQALLTSYEPSLKRIEVTATEISDENYSNNDIVATGFSAGVDSFTTLSLYFSTDNVSRSRKISSLTVFNVGAMGPYEKSLNIFQAYSNRVKKFALDNGLEWQTVNSNLDDFYAKLKLGFQKTHVIRNVAAAYIFEDLYQRYYYSSTYPYKDLNKSNDDMSYVEPILLNLLETDDLKLTSAGAGLSRLEKMQVISDSKFATKLLDVCVGDIESRLEKNCSKCWKCSRAMTNLDVLGKLDDFSDVFDVDYYRNNKEKVIKVIYGSAIKGKPADQDLIELMKNEGYETGVNFNLYTLTFRVKRKIKHILQRVIPWRFRGIRRFIEN